MKVILKNCVGSLGWTHLLLALLNLDVDQRQPIRYHLLLESQEPYCKLQVVHRRFHLRRAGEKMKQGLAASGALAPLKARFSAVSTKQTEGEGERGERGIYSKCFVHNLT